MKVNKDKICNHENGKLPTIADGSFSLTEKAYCDRVNSGATSFISTTVTVTISESVIVPSVTTMVRLYCVVPDSKSRISLVEISAVAKVEVGVPVTDMLNGTVVPS